MKELRLITAAVGFMAATVTLARMRAEDKRKINAQEDRVKSLKECIEYYRKETNRLRDSLATTIEQLQVSRQEVIDLRVEAERQEAITKNKRMRRETK